jgi:hypothetical protein
MRFFTAKSMRGLFEENGYRVRGVTGINRLVAASRLGRLIGRVPRFRDMQYLQFVVTAEPNP